MNRKIPFAASPALALALAFIAPVFFVFSKNWFIFEPEIMLLSSGVVFLLAGVVFLFMLAALRVGNAVSASLPKWLQVVAAAVFCLVLVETCCFSLQAPLHAAIPEPRWLRILVSRVLPWIALLLLVRASGLYPVNVFLAVFWGISFVNLAVPLLTETSSPLENNRLAAYELKKRPNIYLFVLESCHSLDIQRDIYGIDTSGVKNFLASRDFVDYGKIYSNSPHTLLSMGDTFHFNSIREYARGNGDAMPVVRRILGGSKDNTLFRALKANGYTTVSLTGDTGFYGTNRGEFLDDSDRMVLSRRDALVVNTIACIGLINSRLQEEPFGSFGSIRNRLIETKGDYSGYAGSGEERISRATSRHRSPNVPFFLVYKGGGTHTPFDGTYTWRQHKEWTRRGGGGYHAALQAATREWQRVCDTLIAEDPGALIVLIGDHGAFRYHGAEQGAASMADLFSRLKENGISFQDWVDDRHAVFLSIRLPHGQREDIAYGLPLSHVNLFRHIFAWLNDDPDILKTRAPSDSYWKNFPIVKEGKIAASPL